MRAEMPTFSLGDYAPERALAGRQDFHLVWSHARVT
jgi:hypothetical protein